MRAFGLGLLAAGSGLAVVAAVTLTGSLGPGLAAADACVGLTLVVCGVVASEQRAESRTGSLLSLAGFAWLAGSLLPVAIFWHRGPLVHVCVTYPTGRLRRRLAMIAVATAYVDGLIKPLAGNNVVTLGVALLVAVAAVDVYVQSSGPARRSGLVALGSTLAYAGTLTAGALVRILDLNADETVLILYDAIVVSLAVVLLLELLFGRWTENTVADLVVALGQRSGTGRLRDELAKALGDPSLIVGYWIAERGRYVDDAGRQVELPTAGEGRAVTEIDDGDRVAVLVHDPATMDDPRLVAAVAAAARLSVANARLQAEIQGKVSAVAESRRRIVEAVDDQRRRLERELSEGAQRRLAGALQLVDGARCAAPATEAAGLNELEVEIRAAQAELRDFAQGIRPSALDQGGLAAALPALAERVPVPVDLDIDVGRVRPAIEAAIFFVCSEALANVAKHALAQRVWLTVGLSGGAVVASVSDDGVGGADLARGSGLRGLIDRVEALDGRLDLRERADGGTVVTVAIPVDPGGVRAAGSTA